MGDVIVEKFNHRTKKYAKTNVSSTNGHRANAADFMNERHMKTEPKYDSV